MIVQTTCIQQQKQYQNMQGQQMKRPLMMNTTVMEIQTEKEEESAFIVRYNHVIRAYNKYAEEGDLKLEVMVGNRFITRISTFLARPLLMTVLILIFILLPIVNLFCLGCIFIYLYHLKRENKKHQRNLSRVSDPFKNFYFMPEICQHMGKHHTSFNLQQNQIQGFTFNEELRSKLSQKLRQKSNQNSNMTVLIYDQYFYDSFFLYRKEFYKTLIWAVLGVLLMAFSTLLYWALIVGL